MGPLGLKKAEQELIKRRYKYSYNNNDSISRVALVYGQPHGSGSVGNRAVENMSSNLHHAPDGQIYQYASNNRSSGSGSGVSESNTLGLRGKGASSVGALPRNHGGP